MKQSYLSILFSVLYFIILKVCQQPVHQLDTPVVTLVITWVLMVCIIYNYISTPGPTALGLWLCTYIRIITCTSPCYNYILYYIRYHLKSLSPLITFIVNMMYLLIKYQHEALQMPKTMGQNMLQLFCNQVRYGFTKIFPYSSYGA